MRGWIASIIVLMALSGCAHLGYYAQAISGQLEILAARRPIEEWLQDPATPQALSSRLQLVQALRRFAREELALPDEGSYRAYADLGRPYAVWNVFAAPALSLELKKWCYPLIGCMAYHGYFSEGKARAQGVRLSAQGYDVFVAGVPAYSTLGWFDDPLLNTVIDWPETRLAGLMFHELAHQKVFVQGDTRFNESFASLVQEEGVRRWLRTRGQGDALMHYEQYLQRLEAVLELVQVARNRLAEAYSIPTERAEKLVRKDRILAELQQHYRSLKAEWDEGVEAWDGWFLESLNNAKLGAIGTYRDYVPAFRVLFHRHKGDFTAFYEAVEKLAALDLESRTARLRALLPQSLPIEPDIRGGLDHRSDRLCRVRSAHHPALAHPLAPAMAGAHPTELGDRNEDQILRG